MVAVKNNRWEAIEAGVEVSLILRHEGSPEGLDFTRVRFASARPYTLPRDEGALVSVLAGEATLSTREHNALQLAAGSHLYLPPGSSARFACEAGTQLLHACAPSRKRARGTRLLLRTDEFLAGCALPGRSLRWILTPQYLSRRVFLYHDETLLSPTGEPLSWFHTTMFSARGLPPNEEGEPVFKMSYNYRTEPNICYEVRGEARVRVARHPYSLAGQTWEKWETITRESTYHLSESESSAEWVPSENEPLRCFSDERHQAPRRNKHEVQIRAGHVSLICMHNPACTGVERHSAGEYSEYGDPSELVSTPHYRRYLDEIAPLDAAIDSLSLASAQRRLSNSSTGWELHQRGRAAQRSIELTLLKALRGQGQEREKIVEPWMLGEDS